MSVIKRVVKATTRKGKKVLLSREPQLVESPKRALFLKGRKTSAAVRELLKDFFDIKKPLAKILSRKNDITIFENVSPVEALCKKHETPLFVMGSHSKKRPDNIVFGRMYDNLLLDMVEIEIESYSGLKEFRIAKVTLGTKPTLIFNGPAWEESDELKHLKSLFVDMFHREQVEAVRLQGLEHTISFTAENGKILMRSYKVLLKKSGCRTPRIELEEIGPRAVLSIRRSKLASEDLMKESCKKPKEQKVTVKKNITTDGLGATHGRIHIGKQHVDRLQTRKMKGLRKTAEERKADKINKRRAAADTDQLPVKKKKIN